MPCIISWCGVNRLGDSGVNRLGDTSALLLTQQPSKKYRFSRQFMKCLRHLTFLPIKLPTPGGVAWDYFFVITFLGSSWHFPDFWFFDPLKFPLWVPPWPPLSIFSAISRTFEMLTPNPPRNPPGWGGSNKFVLLFWTVHDISRTFDLLTP